MRRGADPMRNDIFRAVSAVAAQHRIPKSSLLALVEVECAGEPFEKDGRTPRLLFERHQFFKYLQARAPQKLQGAIDAGLAHANWRRDTQYKDQGTSAKRLQLIARAREIDAECATLATSWGVGQTMGFCAAEIGFSSATAMVDWMTEGGVTAQVEAMAREIKAKGLENALRKEDWQTFARKYNGPAYARNRYDTKMATAEDRWDDIFPNGDPGETPAAASPALRQVIPKFELEGIQQRLADLGYYRGIVDGKLGTKTVGAIAAFQAAAGIDVDGIYGPQTKAALADANAPRVMPTTERLTATASDLRVMGSQTVRTADQVNLGAKLLAGLGLCGAGESIGALDWAKSTIDQVSAFRPLVDGVGELLKWATGNWPLLAMCAGAAGVWYASRIVRRRVEQFRADANV